ncbi:glycosyltransferase family 4 protein [Blastococcus saxobsidens]|uniref:Glycosyl transferase n=1 Tax=Blastococcus saxobsidens (strain DD2) TaxID=1146883 RepID=H6RKZ1_BLASD|nr:glycosyltransferase family 1 protein [Blastococcus saxobsidens]CCG04958.1 Glycosyl transferase [Blastococcus saxobsidens DD2]
MRVGMVLEQALAPVPGGTGRFAVQLAAALGADPSIEITGWTARHRDVAAARIPGVRGPHRLALPRRALTLAWERGVGPAPRGVDLVHAPTLQLPPRRGRPLVVTIHDAVPWTHPETLTPRGVRWHRAMAERAVAHADAIVTPSAATAAALARHLRLRRSPEVVPLGVTPLPVPGDIATRAAALGLPADGYVLSLATLEPRKGLDVLMRALASPSGPDLPLVLVGAAGWGGVDPVQLAAGEGLAPERVRLLGRVDDDDLAVVLAAATVLAVPSRAEGFGLPVVEGMAAGVPVVTSRDPALLEVGGDAVLAAETGDAESLADALRQVCTDAGLRTQLLRRGEARAGQYSWARCAAGYAEIFRRLV